MNELQKVPDWLTAGITYQEIVCNYQPVTCLTAMYKTLTGIRAKGISTHLEEQNLLPAEQKGCKDRLMISKAIHEECKRRNKNLSTAWIHYQKQLTSFHLAG